MRFIIGLLCVLGLMGFAIKKFLDSFIVPISLATVFIGLTYIIPMLQ